jgi:hypothetical protein
VLFFLPERALDGAFHHFLTGEAERGGFVDILLRNLHLKLGDLVGGWFLPLLSLSHFASGPPVSL